MFIYSTATLTAWLCTTFLHSTDHTVHYTPTLRTSHSQAVHIAPCITLPRCAHHTVHHTPKLCTSHFCISHRCCAHHTPTLCTSHFASHSHDVHITLPRCVHISVHHTPTLYTSHYASQCHVVRIILPRCAHYTPTLCTSHSHAVHNRTTDHNGSHHLAVL